MTRCDHSNERYSSHFSMVVFILRYFIKLFLETFVNFDIVRSHEKGSVYLPLCMSLVESTLE